MKTHLHRDSQQWVFDWLVKEAGTTMHFQADGRGWLPKSVRQHDMIPKHLGRQALQLRGLADEERKAGHEVTALEYYFDAANLFAQAQHPIFENNRAKRGLHGASVECYDHVRELAPYQIEHMEIPSDDGAVFINLHLLPGGGPSPCVIFVPGCDMTKEMYPYPLANHAHQRGMHMVSIDGPGQGESNLRGIGLSAENYERAVSAVVDYLLTRSEVDGQGIVVFGLSFGSHWAVRAAAVDPRIVACAAPWASICDKSHLMNHDSPRYKQLFAYLTQAQTEEELDEILNAMTVNDELPSIRCPTLLTVGEFDARSPLQEILALYSSMTCERELWVFEDQHHMNTVAGHVFMSGSNMWNMDVFPMTLDWLRDRLGGNPIRRSGEVTYVDAAKGGPYGASLRSELTWLQTLDPKGAST
jgi:pimeloyl-ACP methyl ester carboxylesterase